MVLDRQAKLRSHHILPRTEHEPILDFSPGETLARVPFSYQY